MQEYAVQSEVICENSIERRILNPSDPDFTPNLTYACRVAIVCYKAAFSILYAITALEFGLRLMYFRDS